MKTKLRIAGLLFRAVVLIILGFFTLRYSGDLMRILIHYVGEEYALGKDSVIITESGGKLLTNPAAMMRWTLPFLFAGIIQISSAVILFIAVWRMKKLGA